LIGIEPTKGETNETMKQEAQNKLPAGM